VILLDTSVLSLAFRRAPQSGAPSAVMRTVARMIAEDVPVAVPGIVIQELLSGVREAAQFRRLEGALEGFPVVLAERVHHIAAARIANTCRRRGVSVSTIDCLIAALAVAHDAHLFTTDQDFTRIASCCNLRLVDVGQV
jgi:predicted nucleic acid-binding protein